MSRANLKFEQQTFRTCFRDTFHAFAQASQVDGMTYLRKGESSRSARYE